MQFRDAITTCLYKKYADFNGRAGRSEFWWFALFNFLVGYTAGFFPIVLTSRIFTTNIAFKYGSILFALYTALFTLPILSVCVRRLHDIGKDGWWLLMLYIIQTQFFVLTMNGYNPLSIPIMALGVTGLMLFAVLCYWLSNKSAVETNKYGSPP